MKLLVLDKHGHSTITADIDTEFARLCKLGYAAFLAEEQIKELPPPDKRTEAMEVFMISPIAGG